MAGNTLVNTSLPVFLDSVVSSPSYLSACKDIEQAGRGKVSRSLADLRSVAAGLLFWAQLPLK